MFYCLGSLAWLQSCWQQFLSVEDNILAVESSFTIGFVLKTICALTRTVEPKKHFRETFVVGIKIMDIFGGFSEKLGQKDNKIEVKLV